MNITFIQYRPWLILYIYSTLHLTLILTIEPIQFDFPNPIQLTRVHANQNRIANLWICMLDGALYLSGGSITSKSLT